MVEKLEIIGDMVKNSKLQETWLQTWSYKWHGYKLEVLRDMVTTLIWLETW